MIESKSKTICVFECIYNCFPVLKHDTTLSKLQKKSGSKSVATSSTRNRIVLQTQIPAVPSESNPGVNAAASFCESADGNNIFIPHKNPIES